MLLIYASSLRYYHYFLPGIVPTVAKSVVATAVTFAAYEGMKDFLAWNRMQNQIVECSKHPTSRPPKT